MHGRRRDLDKAIDMFNTARIKGVALDEKSYTNVICYNGKAGNTLLLPFIDWPSQF